MWRRFTRWFGRTFGAAPNGDARLVVVFDGPGDVGRLVAMRLKSEGLFVIPDPTPAIPGGPSIGMTRTSGNRGERGLVEVAVRVEDEDRARAIIDAIEPI